MTINNTNSNSRFPIGSKWRKWDLHVHSPASALNNNFTGTTLEEKWKRYYEKLSSLSDVAVLGITDYFSVDGYKKVRDEFDLNNIDLVLPNVELRILPVTGKEAAINLHIIFAPDIVDQLDGKFFSSLEYIYSEEAFKCTRLDLIRLGRKYKNDPSLSEVAAYRAGIEQFKTTIENLKQIFSKDRVLRDRSIVVVSNSSQDGASGIQHSSLATTREEIYRFAHCVFSGNPNDRVYFLGEGVDDENELKRKYGGLKSCIHGSDAHCLETICMPCAKRGIGGHSCTENPELCDLRYCWVKGDPAFEGLRQILHEPRYRVHIGERPPLDPLHKINRVIFDFPEKTQVNTKNGVEAFCFTERTEFHFSPNLTCLIGGRGTGKSTALNLIYEKLNPEATNFDVIKGLRIPGSRTIDDCVSIDGEDEEKYVEFLSQNEVEAFALDHKRFTDAIYQRLEQLDTENKLDNLQRRLRIRIDQTEEQIERIKSRHEKQELLKSKQRELKTNTKLLSSIKSSEYRSLVVELKKRSEELDRIEHSKNDYITLLEELKRLTDDFGENSQEGSNIYRQEYNRLVRALNDLVESSNAIDFKTILASEQTLEVERKTYRGKIREYLEQQGLSQEDLNDISGANDRISKLEREIGGLERGIAELEKQISDFDTLELQKAKTAYKNEIERQIGPVSQDLEDLGGEIKPIRLDYEFSERMAEELLLEEFQTAFRSHRIDYLEQYLFRQTPSEVSLKEELIGKIKGNDKSLNKTQQFLVDLLSIDKNFEIYKLMSQKVYADLDHCKVIRVFYDNKPLEDSSFGQRCTAAMIILLLLGNNPVIIDEPEAHLDSSLIANYLVNVIKNKKQSRQIIFATHNANFVINGDAELIHVLEMDGDVTHVESTTIENLDSRGKLLRLEGGLVAFEMRGEKYNIKKMSQTSKSVSLKG